MEQITRLFSRSMGRWLMALLLVMLSSLAARAAEAYACYTSTNTTLTFYYDNLRATRPGTTYDLNTGSNDTDWETSGTSYDVTRVVFNSSFANARPTTTYSWFYDMGNLQSITGISYLNTSAVTNMAYMFGLCANLTSLDVSGFNTANVTKMGGMFCGCSSLTTLDLSNFNTANVTDMQHMFDASQGLTSVDLSSFNTTKVTNMAYMFLGCNNLATIYAGRGWNTENVTNSSDMFLNCTSIRGGQGLPYISDHVDKYYAHVDCIDNRGYLTGLMEAYACYTPSNTTLTFYYDNQRYGRPTQTYDLNTGYNIPGWVADNTNQNVTQVAFYYSFRDARPTSTYKWFFGMQNLSYLSAINYLNTSEVTNMAYMFASCSSLSSINVSNFNTSKVTNMNGMFQYCSGLYNLHVNNFNTENVTNMSDMFFYCSNLQQLDVTNFNTAKVTKMGDMFDQCTNLSRLDLSSFNTANVTNMDGMFSFCRNLTTIYVGSEWSTTAVVVPSGRLFDECTKLVGGMGTTYSIFNTEVDYAHLDYGPSNPGYFTAPNEAYACYTPSNNTLTFYYNGLRHIQEGTTYSLNEGTAYPGWYSDGTYTAVKQVLFDWSFIMFRPTSTYYWFNGMSSLNTILGIHNLNTSLLTSMKYMFYGCSSLTELDVSGFNTAKVTDMSLMFGNCSSLKMLNLGNFNTSNVTNMSYMFLNCSHLTTIYAGDGWSTAAVTNSNNMFQNCTRLVGGQGTTYNSLNPKDKTYAHIDGGTSNPGYFHANAELYVCYTPSNATLTFYFDNLRSTRPGTTYHMDPDNPVSCWMESGNQTYVTKVVFDPSLANARPTNATGWFSGMQNLQSITGMEYLNTSEVTSMSYMFNNCSKLASLDLSNFNTANVTYMEQMFNHCKNLTSLDLSSFNTSNVYDMSAMFKECTNLSRLDLSSFNTANVTNMNDMFGYCTNLTSVDLSSFNTDNVTSKYGMNGMFCYCTSLTNLDLSSFNTANVTYMEQMFSNCSNLRKIYAGNGWSTAAVTNSTDMFANCTSLVGGKGTTYDASHTDAAYAHIDGGPSNPGYFSETGPEAYACYTPADMTLTFYYDTERFSREGTTYDLNTEQNLPGWHYCNIRRVVFNPSFAAARPTTTFDWFFSKTQLTTIVGLSNLNTSEVTDMRAMFASCESLTSLDLSSFNTSKVKSMAIMFINCRNLTSLNLSSFNTANVEDMSDMFDACDNLTRLDLSSFNTAKVTAMGSMFCNCENLQTIYVGNEWSTAAVTSSGYMFSYCKKLVGGQGTTYDASHTDAAYAHIDGGPSNPGYFSEKPAFIRGDVNGNGIVNISDVTELINYLLSGNASGINLNAADCNEDGNIKIGDVTTLINFLLSGSW